MKIRTLRDMGFDGKHTKAGTVVECPPTLARYLVVSGRAEHVEESTESEVETETEGLKPFPPQDEDEHNPAPKPKGKSK